MFFVSVIIFKTHRIEYDTKPFWGGFLTTYMTRTDWDEKKKACLDSTYGQALTTSNFHRQPSAKEMVKSERAISLQKGLRY